MLLSFSSVFSPTHCRFLGLFQQGMADGQRLVELAQDVIASLEREEAENQSALDRLTEEGEYRT